MYNLVIVDDENKIAEGIANLFPWEDLGFKVNYFIDSEKALKYILANDVDVVLSDIEMPKINGIELCEKIKDKDIIVVFLSSYQEYDYFRWAIKYKVEDYLIKPLKSSDIIATFGSIKEKLDRKNKINVQKPKPYYEQIIEKVNEYISENYKNASLDEASEVVNLSPNYISRILKDRAEYSFSEFLMKVRMEKAKELLNDFKYKSYDIAYYIGYDNPKNFSRAFKAYYGITPNEYRKLGEK
ncbi:MAG: response regulator [Lachnospirales bacterium]